MKVMFEIVAGYECGGPEDGMMVREGSCEYETDVNLFQPLEKLFKQVEDEYRSLYGDDEDFLGCRVIRIIPHDEANKIREQWKLAEEYCKYYDC